MKSLFKKSTLCLIAGSSIPAMAAPLISLGDSLDLYFNGSATARYQSNVFLQSANEEGDTSFIFSPGIELAFGRTNSELSGKLQIREDFDVYVNNSQLDNHKANIFFNGRYDTGVFKLTGRFSFAEVDQNTADTALPPELQGKLIEREITSAEAYAEYQVSTLTSIGAGVTADHIFYQTFQDRFSDQTQIGIPVDAFWKYSEKLDFSVGYRYRDTDVGRGTDTQDHFFNVGARGDLAPKLQGRVQVGYTVREYDSATMDNEGTFTVITGLTYQATPKVLLGLDLSRDYGTAGTGSSIESTTARLKADYSLNNFFAINTNLGYSKADYTNNTRQDDTYDFGIGLSYTPNDYIRLSAGYIYQKNESDGVGGVSYDNNVINVSASLRY
ncbi:MAG: outer membrane beta-barrel protein [Verrucomicrobiota bacterium]|nr:outer membrane beta-barrel protein [Verrucomicrobiota bacterium]